MKKLTLAALLVLSACATEKAAEPPAAEKPAEPYVLTLDDSDRVILDRTLQQAATRPSGQIIVWNNPSNGRDGTLTMIRQGFTRDGRNCGEVHYEARYQGYRAQEVKRVCRGADGKWAPENGF